MSLKISFPASLPAATLRRSTSGGGARRKTEYELGLILKEDKARKTEQERKIDAEVLNAATDAFLAAKRFDLIERDQLAAVFTEKSLQDFIGGKVNNKLTDVLALDLLGVVSHTEETTKSDEGEAPKPSRWSKSALST